MALAVTGVVVATRIVWGEATTGAAPRRPTRGERARRVGWRPRLVSGWAGFRGAVRCRGARRPADHAQRRALPGPQPDHLRRVFVILVTVIVQGSTLPQSSAGPSSPRTLPTPTNCNSPAAVAQAALERCRWSPPNSASARTLGAAANGIRRTCRDHHGRRDDPGTTGRAQRAGPASASGRARTQAPGHPALRDQKIIDDIVLRELQGAMDLEEVRLLDTADSE